MTPPDPLRRHLSLDGFCEYLRSGAPAVVRLDGSPVVYLVIDPAPQRLALRTPLQRHAVPDLSEYRHISAGSIYWNDAQWCELRVDGDLVVDAYPIICAIADRIQLRSMDFGAAVNEALVALRHLLASAARLSDEHEIGLFGELLLLRHLLTRIAPDDALAAWRGPTREEHDFVLGDIDVEVKSTLAERRTHWIGDLRQLEPKLNRRLLLLSVQLTAAGAGGLTLPQLVDEVGKSLPKGSAVADFRQLLETLNWSAVVRAPFTRRLQLRSVPALFEVDHTFPALTSKRLEAAGLELNRFSEVRYAVDLTGLPAAADTPDHLKNIGSGV